MTTGLPVVTTTNAGSSELIDEGHDCVIVSPGDANALAHAISRLFERPAMRQQMGNAARKRVEGAHSWEAYGASVLQAIDARRVQPVQRGVPLS